MVTPFIAGVAVAMDNFARRTFKWVESKNWQRDRVRLLIHFTVLIVALSPIACWGCSALPYSAMMMLAGLALLHVRGFLMLFLCGLALLPAMLGVLSFLDQRRDPPAEYSCGSNMKKLALAVMNYESTNGHFPPPFLADEHGVPMHSCAVLILPYIDEQNLFAQYDFSKPWNHPDNIKLADQMPSVFACPSDPSALSQHTTTYVAVVGPRTMWPAGATDDSRT